MLVLMRRVGERLIINDDITVKILEIKGNQARIGIKAPKDVSVHREEIWLKIKGEQVNIDIMDEQVKAAFPKSEPFYST